VVIRGLIPVRDVWSWAEVPLGNTARARGSGWSQEPQIFGQVACGLERLRV
jgi:hypothetical protein